MAGDVCRNCGDSNIIIDPDSGRRVCKSCGCIHDSNIFQNQEFASDGTRLGTLVRSCGDFGYRERKLYGARATITDITNRLGLSATRAADVVRLASQATDDELGSGDWFRIFVSACCVIVMRQHRSPLSLTEAAAVIGRRPHDLGRMVLRLANHLDLGQLPDLDSVLLLERFVHNFRPFSSLDKEKFKEILGQGRFILHCAMRWFLTTGRQPLPVITAVLAFVANVNGLKVGLEEIAVETHAGVVTSHTRLKELMELLVKVSKALLPWGEDVSIKNIVQHAPVLIRFMELKSKSKFNTVGDDNSYLSNVKINLGDILGIYSDCVDVVQEESRYFRLDEEGNDNPKLDIAELEKLKLSSKRISISHAYDRVLDTKLSEGETENIYGTKRRRAVLEIEDWIESWSGRWETDKGLTLEQVLHRSEGYDALPPSFINGLEMRRKRRRKMEAAKHRIHEIMRMTPDKVVNVPNKGKDYRVAELTLSRKRRKGRKIGGVIDELDWEDCIIELLMLHQVEEEEVEQGHYSRLLDLYVFNSSEACYTL